MEKNLRPYVAELIGTFAVVFVSAGAVCGAYMPSDRPQIDVTGIALAQGLITAVALAGTVYVSGGYLNPAVTVTLYTLRRIDTPRFVWLLAAQLLGAVLAGGLVRLLFHDDVLSLARFGTPHVNADIYNLPVRDNRVLATATGVEVVLSFLFTFVLFSTVIDARAQRGGPWLAGLAVVALVLTGFHITEAGLNPARCLGTFVWEVGASSAHPSWREHLLVYWVGPVLGALLAGWVYTLGVMPTDRELRQGHGGALDPTARPRK
jgi:MIP family channel proteins